LLGLFDEFKTHHSGPNRRNPKYFGNLLSVHPFTGLLKDSYFRVCSRNNEDFDLYRCNCCKLTTEMNLKKRKLHVKKRAIFFDPEENFPIFVFALFP
jgi:hypothetical protein